MSLDLWRLRYFAAVAEREHVGHAAAWLGISQPPLSRQIAELEADLGLSLFRRERRRLRLTPAGRDLLRDVQGLLAHAERVERRARATAEGTTGRLRIGYVAGALHCGVLTTALNVYRRRQPTVVIEMKEGRSSEQLDALRRGSLDLAYVHSPPSANADGTEVRVRRVADEPFELALPAMDSRVTEGPLDTAALHGFPLITVPAHANPQAHEQLLAACAVIGFVPQPRHEAVSPASALALVAAGLGCAVIQASLCVDSPPGVVFRALPDFPMRMQVFAVTPQTPVPQLLGWPWP